ncbi:hypothetical protein NA57DRAFT_62435 [Rhizodiscina lignyota]|uniref:DUF7580 domain-containing protein n=1 Tax=Rhizodiscina lignyota TaxID=1504668 RepID=A0A9P4M2L8_9PEZI|nr:hypothetical protein NA57DRAFT_62435 [Rhizodiscina lignyota]
MSGVELMLAILPLVVSAIEYHKEGIRLGTNLSSAKAKDNAHLDFFWELHDELALLGNTLAAVLCNLPSRPLGFELSPLSPLTEEETREIDYVLGISAQPFHNILDRMLKSLEALVSDRSLNLTESDLQLQSSEAFCRKLRHFKAQIDDGEMTQSLRKRFQFTRNEKSRKVAMIRIQDANKKLERLLRGSMLPEHNVKRRPGLIMQQSRRLRRLSEPLFNTMAREWPKTCECGQHEARLCLWNCCSSPQCQGSNDDSLEMLVSVTDLENDGAPWQESIILIPEQPEQSSTMPTVRFVIDGEPVETASTPPAPGKDIDSESLCRLIRQAHEQNSTLQIRFDRGKLWQIQSRKKSLHLQSQRDTTLKELLENPDRDFKLKEKWILAVILAHAALHCSDGPWLCKDWSKEHITFFRNDPSAEEDLSRPCLKVQFVVDSNGTAAVDDPFRMHSNPALLSLGILLLEIYIRGPIEERWNEEDLTDGEPNENTNLTTALRLLQASDGDLYEGYRGAIQACLECEEPGINGDMLRQRVYERIVSPLEQELAHGFPSLKIWK